MATGADSWSMTGIHFNPSLAQEVATAWNRSLFAALEPKSSGVYANFLEDEGDARIRVA